MTSAEYAPSVEYRRTVKAAIQLKASGLITVTVDERKDCA
jgi:hypothetical protein